MKSSTEPTKQRCAKCGRDVLIYWNIVATCNVVTSVFDSKAIKLCDSCIGLLTNLGMKSSKRL